MALEAGEEVPLAMGRAAALSVASMGKAAVAVVAGWEADLEEATDLGTAAEGGVAGTALECPLNLSGRRSGPCTDEHPDQV